VFLRGRGAMKTALVAGFGFLVLVSSMAGCMQGAATAPAVSLQQECERSSGGGY